MPRFSAVSRCAFHSLCLSTLPVRTVFFRVVPLLVLTLSSVVVQAQSDTATLSGIVTDERGAMVSGVNITVINIAQNFQRSTTTNDEGTFVVVSLTPGNYSVKAEHDGFSTAELKDVILNVNDQRLIKILLKVGNISQTVEIVDSSSFINQSPAVATIVDRQFVDNLPLNGRSFQFLINLSPGVVLTKSTGAEQGQFSVNGQRASANYFTVDGVSGNIGAIATIVP
ncbi:MAG TPA: carboxypeptidase-like regulatory domain-containing protein, partial [Pyrinomonadaceae bacterium]|nr:carboxypeptidase-like regulatory domain-containing protein [Pyrinomonadaceae bacterium]